MTNTETRKPMKYYVDFENVHGQGLKGVTELAPEDHVLIFYSQAAETFHIEHAIDIMKSQARIEFVEVDGGTRNALDFQLVAALYGAIDDAYDYAIVSGDVGFEAAIRMGERMELPRVVRMTNLLGDVEQVKSRSRRGRGSKSAAKKAEAESQQAALDHGAAAETGATGAAEARAAGVLDGTDGGQHEAPATETPAAANPGSSAFSNADAPESAASATAVADETPGDAADVADVAGTLETATASTDDETAAPDAAPTEEPSAETPAPEPDQKPASSPRRRGSRGSGKSGKREEVAAVLANAGIEITQQQLSTIMQALNGVKDKQTFYRRIVQLEKQEKGLALYRTVRDHYLVLAEIVR